MRIGVIDIGSNSIKLLIADKGGSTLAIRYETTWETRISEGISKENPILSEESIAAGVSAVEELIQESKSFEPHHFAIVATSAVRDAANNARLIRQIREVTGHELQVLTPEEEAAYIAWGIASDPLIEDNKEVVLCDLGGGSMELIHVKDGATEQMVSLPLGAVRLTERYITNPSQPLAAQEEYNIRNATALALKKSNFRFPKDLKVLIGSGGACNVCRAIRAHWLATPADQTDPALTKPFLDYLCSEISSLPIDRRTRIEHLPAQRADIFPAAVLTLRTLLEYANHDKIIHSTHSLRHGIAARFYSEQFSADT